jgi:hypothetical protein
MHIDESIVKHLNKTEWIELLKIELKTKTAQKICSNISCSNEL